MTFSKTGLIIIKKYMNIFVVKWPNGTISIVSADTISQLFNMLDTEGDPEQASIYKLKPDENGHFHLTTEIVKDKIKVNTNFELDCKLKRRKNLFDVTDWHAEIC